MATCVVIVTFNQSAGTIGAIRHIHDLPDRPEEIIVVDNGSRDDEAALIDALGLPEVTTIRLEKNVGYARACNIALRRALDGACDAVLLLNNDAIVEPGCIARLRAALEEGSYAAACPLIVDMNDPAMVNAAGGECLPAAGFVANRLKGQRREVALRPTAVNFAPGTALLVKRQAFDKVGLIPERWFLYFEDVEFSLNLTREGLKIVYVPEAVVAHAEGSTMSHTGENYFYYWRNYLLFLAEYARGWRRVAKITHTLGRMALMIAANLAHHKPWRARLLLLAAWAGLRRDWASRMPTGIAPGG